jgi:TonB-dependent receptor
MQNLSRTLLRTAIGMMVANQAAAAVLKLDVFVDGNPSPQTEIYLDGQAIGHSDSNGQFVYEDIDGGRHEIQLVIGDKRIPYRFSVKNDEAAFITMTGQSGSDKAATTIQHVALSALDLSAGAAGISLDSASGDKLEGGSIQGAVLGADDGKPLRNVAISVVGSDYQTVTDRDGMFNLALPAGEYLLELKHPDYRGSRLRDLRVLPGMALALDVNLDPAPADGAAPARMEEVVVVARYAAANAIQIEKLAVGVVDSVDIEQLARFDDSTVSSAIRRVVGVTLEDGRFPIVRGLKGRYQSVYFNGAMLPSTDPSRRDLPLDIFPSGIMQGIDLQKTATADVPGGATAGHISMRTRDIPDEPFFKISASFTRGDNHSDDALKSTTEGDTDWLGIDDGTRDVPEPVKAALGVYSDPRQTGGADPLSREVREAVGEGLEHNAIVRSSAPGDVSLDLAGGKSWELEDQRLGFIAAARYANTWSNDRKISSNFGPRNRSNPDEPPVSLVEYSETEDTNNIIDLSAMLNLQWDINDLNQLGLNNIILRHTTNSAELTESFEITEYIPPGAPIVFGNGTNRSMAQNVDWVEEQLLSHQLWAKHHIPLARGHGWASYLGDLAVDWQLMTASTEFNRPNATLYTYEAGGVEDEYAFDHINSINQYNLWETMEEDSENYRLDLELPLEPIAGISWTFKTGIFEQNRDREGTYHKFNYSGTVRNKVPDEVRFDPDPRRLFVPEYIGSGEEGSGPLTANTGTIKPEDDVGLAGNDYLLEQEYNAFYYLVKANLFQKLDVNVGLRQESFEVAFEQYEYTPEPLSPILNEDRELPSLLLNYMFSDTLQLRAAYSKTVSWPESFELIPRLFYDFETLIRYRGNPELKPADIKNYDLRLEWYPSDTESITLAWFSKDLKNAVENRFDGGFDDFTYYTFANIDDSEIDGWELDLRKTFVLGALQGHEIFVQFNYTDISSSVDVTQAVDDYKEYDPGRPLQGQPDYIVNLQLGYDHVDTQQEITLIFNRKGEELAVVSPPSNSNIANVYELPFNDLKFIYKKSFDNGMAVSFSVDNILDEKREMEYENYNAPYYSSSPGRKFKLKFNYSF